MQTEAPGAVRIVFEQYKPQNCRGVLFCDWNIRKPMEISASLKLKMDIIFLVFCTL
jgi:hypothetical protein